MKISDFVKSDGMKDLYASAGLAGLVLALATGCEEAKPDLSAEARTARANKIVDHSAGVFEFPSAEFPTALAEFRVEHPELKVISVTQGKDIFSTSTAGSKTFIVVTEER